jgi:hypothetical protein
MTLLHMSYDVFDFLVGCVVPLTDVERQARYAAAEQAREQRRLEMEAQKLADQKRRDARKVWMREMYAHACEYASMCVRVLCQPSYHFIATCVGWW